MVEGVVELMMVVVLDKEADEQIEVEMEVEMGVAVVKAIVEVGHKRSPELSGTNWKANLIEYCLVKVLKQIVIQR